MASVQPETEPWGFCDISLTWRKSQRSCRLYLSCPSVRTLFIHMFADTYSLAASCGCTVVIIPPLRSNHSVMSVGPRRLGCLRMVPFFTVTPAIINLYAGKVDSGPYFLKTWVVVGWPFTFRPVAAQYIVVGCSGWSREWCKIALLLPWNEWLP